MKKLLSVLATVGVVASSSTSVVACGTKKEDGKSKPEEPKNITQVVQNFEQDVTKIWSEHYEKEIAGNLITVEEGENDYKFLNKKNIQKFSKPENKDKLKVEQKKEFTNDVEKLFKTKLLKQKLNDLKKVNEYKIILDEVDSVFEHVELLFNDNFEINSGEIVSDAYIGNIVVDYNIVTNYKGLIDVEKFKQSGTLKYTSTESESFKKVGDAMYKNIAKDIFTLSEMQKHVNLKWSDIKGTSADSDAYLSSNAQLKKYYNDNEDFHKALLKLVKDKYFKDSFSALDISYAKKSIYKTDNFTEQNKDYLIINNVYKSDNDIVTFDLSKREDNIIRKIFLTDNDALNEFLLVNQFSPYKWSRIRNNYKVVQDTFLNTFLNKNEISEYQKTNYYNLAVAMGYIDFVGPSIKIGSGESTYNHQLPDFKLAISYSMNGVTDQNYETLIDLSLKLFEVYKNLYEPYEFNAPNNIFTLHFENKPNNLWKLENKIVSNLTNLEINSYLKDFGREYYSKKLEALNKLKISEKSLLKKDVYFFIENINNNLINNVSLYFSKRITNGVPNHTYSPLFYFNYSSENEKKFENFDYMILNLFGVIKIKIKFNREYKEKYSMVLF